MKITQRHLKRIISEEIQKCISEAVEQDDQLARILSMESEGAGGGSSLWDVNMHTADSEGARVGLSASRFLKFTAQGGGKFDSKKDVEAVLNWLSRITSEPGWNIMAEVFGYDGGMLGRAGVSLMNCYESIIVTQQKDVTGLKVYWNIVPGKCK